MYREYVDIGGLGEQFKKMCMEYDHSGEWNEVTIAAAAHLYVSEHVENIHTETLGEECQNLGPDNERPEVLKSGGTSVEQGIFLASMLARLPDTGLKMIEMCEEGGGGKLLLQLNFHEKEHEEVMQELNSFYSEVKGWEDLEYKHDSMGDDTTGYSIWYNCDPFYGVHLSDIKGLEKEDYLYGFGMYNFIKFSTREVNFAYLS